MGCGLGGVTAAVGIRVGLDVGLNWFAVVGGGLGAVGRSDGAGVGGRDGRADPLIHLAEPAGVPDCAAGHDTHVAKLSPTPVDES